MKQTSQTPQTAVRSWPALLILAASLVIAPLAPATHATGARSAKKLCSRAAHPEREVIYDASRMKVTLTFDIENCMDPGGRIYHVQLRLFRTDIMGFGLPAGTGKVCYMKKPPCRLTVSLDHDPVEVASEYWFEAFYPNRQDRGIRNRMGTYTCTSLLLYQECLTEEP